MKKVNPRTENNRLAILRSCYKLMAKGTWESISVSEIEKNIRQTRGAIFYFNKNKEDLFINIINELFLPVFKLSQSYKKILKSCSAETFFTLYQTPFERVYTDLKKNYQLDNPSQGLFNILIQAQNHYIGFKKIIGDSIKNEMIEIDGIIGLSKTIPCDINNIYTRSVGSIFLESFI